MMKTYITITSEDWYRGKNYRIDSRITLDDLPYIKNNIEVNQRQLKEAIIRKKEER
jgi:hypothetical protein